MQIRAAKVADAEAIERARIRGWQVAYRNIFPPAELDALEVDATRWREWLSAADAGGKVCLVAEEDAVVGFANFGPCASPDGCGELYGLYVDPDRWGAGVGRALLERAEAELARTWEEAILWTLEDNPRTRRFYEANGWRHDGTTGTFERLGVRAPTVRYAKRLSSSTSRS